jgi:hypothetical protein
MGLSIVQATCLNSLVNEESIELSLGRALGDGEKALWHRNSPHLMAPEREERSFRIEAPLLRGWP